MKAVSPNQTFDYICESERDSKPEDQTVFVCSYLSAEQEAALDDTLGYQDMEKGYVLTAGKTNLLALHLGLKEIRNLTDENGNQIELKRDETKAKNALPGVGRPWKMDGINKIPKEARDEVARAIRIGATLTEGESKNS